MHRLYTNENSRKILPHYLLFAEALAEAGLQLRAQQVHGLWPVGQKQRAVVLLLAQISQGVKVLGHQQQVHHILRTGTCRSNGEQVNTN